MIFKYEICDACETVAHCRAFGCVPIKPQQKPAFHGFMDKENCTVNLCFTPHAPGGPNNELPTAYYTQPPAQRKPLSNFAKAGIYVKHFGNPVPAAWYAAITELEAAYNIGN